MRLSNFIAIFSVLVAGCSHNIKKYANNTPKADFKSFYSSKLVAHGVLFDIFGDARSSFIMTSEPIPEKSTSNYLALRQSITYLDTKKRKNMISYASFGDDYPEHFKYKDEMMESEATYSQYGNALNVAYKLNVERDNGSTIVLSADDWAFMVDESHMVNKIKLKKFGITVGTIVMSISKAR